MATFWMSPPRIDWRVHGKANVFSTDNASPIALGAARADWLRLADAILAAGARIAVVNNANDGSLTGLPYMAEAGQQVMRDGRPLFVLPRLTPAHRQREPLILRRFCLAMGIAVHQTHNRFEGQGDVIALSPQHVVLTSGLGRFARTTAAGIDEVRGLFDASVLHLRFAADPYFHGNTFLGAFRGPRGTVVLACPQALLPGEWERLAGFVKASGDNVRLVPVTRADTLQYITNALVVNDVVLTPTLACHAALSAWRSVGLSPVLLPLPVLFGRGGGAAVCLTQRVDDKLPLPSALNYVQQRPTLVAECVAVGAL